MEKYNELALYIVKQYELDERMDIFLSKEESFVDDLGDIFHDQLETSTATKADFYQALKVVSYVFHCININIPYGRFINLSTWKRFYREIVDPVKQQIYNKQL